MKNPPFEPNLARARSEALRLTKTIVEGIGASARILWDVGRALERIRDQKLYVALDYPSFRAYVDGEVSCAATQAYLMIRAVQSFTRDDLEKLEGIERAGALITYAKQLAGKVDPGALLRDGVLIGDKPVTAVSVRELRAATNELRAARAARRARAPAARQAKKRDAALVAALRSRHRKAGLGRAVITLSAEHVIVRFSRNALASRLKI